MATMRLIDQRSGLMECPNCGHREFKKTGKRKDRPEEEQECPECQPSMVRGKT